MGRLLALSDVHGSYQKFESMLEKINLTKEDKLIVLGDNIDRGPENMDMVFRLMQLKKEYDIVTLKGNHEEMFLEAVTKNKTIEQIVGSPFYSSYSNNGTMVSLWEYFKLSKENQAIIKKEIESYKLYHIEDDFLFVHAGVAKRIPIERQNEGDLLWIRERFTDEHSHGLPYTVVFGHTPTIFLNQDRSFTIWRKNDKIGIDCGASYGGSLACIDLTNNIEYYV